MKVRTRMLAALLLALPLAVTAERLAPRYALTVSGEIEVAPNGSVHDYRLSSKLTPEIAAIVDKRVRAWKFEPILIDGKPVIAKTNMRLELDALPVDTGYQLKVSSLGFGEPARRSGMKPPAYPKTALKANLGAEVQLALKLDETGRVVDVFPYQTSLGARTPNERIAKQWRYEFERVSIAAAKTWKFDLSESIDGKPVDTIVGVPVRFSMASPFNKAVGWQAYVPGPINPYPSSWSVTATLSDQAELASLKEGEVRSMNSRFKLKENVIGEML